MRDSRITVVIWTFSMDVYPRTFPGEHSWNITSSSAVADRPQCRVGQFWPKVENDIL